VGEDHLRRFLCQLSSGSLNAACAFGGEMKLDPDVAILAPSQVLQATSKCRDVELALGIAFSKRG
jgi:hypothetical protein